MKADLLTLVAALQRMAVRPWEDVVSLDDYVWLAEMAPACCPGNFRDMAEAGTLTVATLLGAFAPALLHTEGGNTRPTVGCGAVTVDVNGFDVLDRWVNGALREARMRREGNALLVADNERLKREVKRLSSVGRWMPGHLAGLGMTRQARRTLVRAVVAAFDAGAEA